MLLISTRNYRINGDLCQLATTVASIRHEDDVLIGMQRLILNGVTSGRRSCGQTA